MYKRVIKKVVCLFFAIILTINYGSFSVSADLDGSYYYVPSDSVLAYQFFLNYNLSWGKLLTLGRTETIYDQHTINSPLHTIGCNYNKFVNTNSGQDTYFYAGSSQVSTPQWRVNTYNLTASSYSSFENNQMTSILSYPSLKGTIINPAGYSANQRVQLRPNGTIIISFISFQSQSQNTTFFSSTSNNDFTSTAKVTQILGNNKAYKYIYTVTSNTTSTQWITPRFYFSSNEVEIIPLYIGDTSEMTDDMTKQLGLDTEIEVQLKISNERLNDIYNELDNIDSKLSTLNNTTNRIDNKLNTIINGNSASQEKVNNNNNTTNEFNTESNNYYNIESNSINDMQSQLNNINLDNDLYSNTGFVDGAWFVKKVFTDLVETYNESIGIKLVIMFSLILGLALTIIGKLRN